MSDQVERFRPTSGLVTGGLIVAFSVLVAGVGLVAPSQGVPAWLIALSAFVAALSWASMLRPAVALVGDDLRMRNMLETVHVPLTEIEDVAVRQVLVVRADGRRFVSPAVGRTRRQLGRDAMLSGDQARQLAEASYGAFVEERIRSRAADALARSGSGPSPSEQPPAAVVRRQPAWPEIIALSGTAVAFVVTLLL